MENIVRVFGRNPHFLAIECAHYGSLTVGIYVIRMKCASSSGYSPSKVANWNRNDILRKRSRQGLHPGRLIR